MRFTFIIMSFVVSTTAFAQKQTIKISSSRFTLAAEGTFHFPDLKMSGFNSGFYTSDQGSSYSNSFLFSVGTTVNWYMGKNPQRASSLLTGILYTRHGGLGQLDPDQTDIYRHYNDPEYQLNLQSVRMPVGANIGFRVGKKKSNILGLSTIFWLRHTFKATTDPVESGKSYDVMDEINATGLHCFTVGPQFRTKSIYIRTDVSVIGFGLDKDGDNIDRLSGITIGYLFVK